jgi:hypothetical protein
MMTVREMREMLEAYHDDAPVRIMSQPNWPFEYDIEGIWVNENDDEDDAFVNDESGHKPVFLVEGYQRGYGTKRAWDECERF